MDLFFIWRNFGVEQKYEFPFTPGFKYVLHDSKVQKEIC